LGQARVPPPVSAAATSAESAGDRGPACDARGVPWLR